MNWNLFMFFIWNNHIHVYIRAALCNFAIAVYSSAFLYVYQYVCTLSFFLP